jgi:hypothetical protein
LSTLRPLRLKIEELMGLDMLEGSSGTGVRGSVLCRGELDSVKVVGVMTDDVEEKVSSEGKSKKKVGLLRTVATMLEMTHRTRRGCWGRRSNRWHRLRQRW